MNSEHIPAEMMFGYEHGLLKPEEVLRLHQHLDACADCRRLVAGRSGLPEMVGDVRQALNRTEPAARGFWPGREWMAYAAAAMLVVAVGIGYRMMRGGSTAQNPAVVEALRTGKIARPAFLAELAGPREILMGRANQPDGDLLSPSGLAVLSRRPSFSWKTLPGSWRYHVRVYEPSGAVFAESGIIRESSWTCGTDLAQGVTYQWQVTAMREDQRLTLPNPPARPPRFRVVDAATAAHLQRLIQSGAAHLELAVEYGRAGLMDESYREMEAAVALQPRDAGLRQLLDSLQSGSEAATR